MKVIEIGSVSIQTFDAKAGKRQATYCIWGNPSGTDVPTDDSRGYLIDMKRIFTIDILPGNTLA